MPDLVVDAGAATPPYDQLRAQVAARAAAAEYAARVRALGVADTEALALVRRALEH